MCIFIIGGFGATTHYMDTFTKYLQYYTQYPVQNYSLLHGYTIEFEVSNIIAKILQKTTPNHPIILFGFSTGCIVVLQVAKLLHIKSIYLCNSAEIITRFPEPGLHLLTNGNETPYHFKLYKQLIKKSNISQKYWNIMGYIIEAFWIFLLFILGSSLCAYIYFHNYGKTVFEPRPDELSRVVFSKSPSQLKTTVYECFIKHNLNDLIRSCNTKIHLIMGKYDFYFHCSQHILNNFDNKYVTKNIIDGEHHMLYNKPQFCAKAISNIMMKNSLYDFGSLL